MALPHIKIIEENGIDIDAITDEDFKIKFISFEKTIYGLESDLEEQEEDEETTKEELTALRTQLLEVSTEFAQAIKEYLDDEATDDVTPEGIKESILQSFLDQGKNVVKLKELRNAGYDVKKLDQYGITSETVKSLTIRKESTYSENFIIKTKA